MVVRSKEVWGLKWGFRRGWFLGKKVLVHKCSPSISAWPCAAPPAHLVEAGTGELLLQGL